MITTHTEDRFHNRHAQMFHYGATAVTIGTIASLAISAAGTGLSMYAQGQQAENAEKIANYNFKVAEQNARIEAHATKIRAGYQAQQAQNEYQTRQNNATQLETQARAVESQQRTETARMVQEIEQRQAIQRARYAKSGVTSEGSPISVMARSAALLQLALEDGSYEAEMKARSLDRQAGLERAGSEFSLFDKAIADYEGAAARSGMQVNLNIAEADRAAGLSNAQGYRMAQFGTLLSGLGDMSTAATSGLYKMKDLSKTKPAKASKGTYTGNVGGLIY